MPGTQEKRIILLGAQIMPKIFPSVCKVVDKEFLPQPF
jgi:hypothetical protein